MTKHVLKTDPKFLRRQFEKAVGKSIPKILTELITNSDDSYKRMIKDQDNRTASEDFGRINIIVDYRKKVIKVIDQAQGLSKTEMENKFVVYGKEPDDRKSGTHTRSLFGKGLRDVLFTQKVGFVKSIKDRNSSVAKFYWDRVRDKGIEEPIVEIKQGPHIDKDLRAGWDITENGTVVEFRLRDDVRLPPHAAIVEKLGNFYMLRVINSNPKRKVVLTSISKFGEKAIEILQYSFPSGEAIAKKSLTLKYCDKEFPVELELSKCTDNLVQGGLGYEEREGGLLVIDEDNNALDLTLFGFDADPSATRLYGLLRVIGLGAFIAEKLHANPPEVILSEEREGFYRTHPFYRALANLVNPILEPFVREERLKESSRGQFSSETRVRHKDAMNVFNKMYRELVGRPEIGDGLFGKEPYVPEFISFIRPQITINKETKTPIALLVNCTTIPESTKINISSNNPKITVFPENFIPNYSVAKDNILTKVIQIIGYEHGITGEISARAGDHSASVIVSVIDKELFYPKNGIEFHPSHIKARDGRKKSLHLYVDVEKVPVGSVIRFSCDSSNFSVSKDKVQFIEEMKITTEIGHLTIEIIGHGIGQQCKVKAIMNEFTAIALIVVASKRDRKIREQGARFKPPEFMHIPSLKVQTWIRPNDGTILVNLSDPLNKKYFGDEPYKKVDSDINCQTRLADLVLDECLNEIVSQAWGKTLPRRFPDNPEVDIRLYVAEKKFEIGQLVHSYFVKTH